MRMSPDFVSAIIATLSISLSIHIHCTYYSYITHKHLKHLKLTCIYTVTTSYSPGFISIAFSVVPESLLGLSGTISLCPSL